MPCGKKAAFRPSDERLVKRMKSGAPAPLSPPSGSEHEFMLHELRKILGTKCRSNNKANGEKSSLILLSRGTGENFELLSG